MTREEAITILTETQVVYFAPNGKKKVQEALDMAIEALQAEPTKAVPPSLADVYKWERDIALSQLEEYGIGFAEKKRDDLVEVVRCKDCKWAEKAILDEYCVECTMYHTSCMKHGYCHHGERREE